MPEPSPNPSSGDMVGKIEFNTELEAIRALRRRLRVYLQNMKTMRQDLKRAKENCKEQNKVNRELIDELKLEQNNRQ